MDQGFAVLFSIVPTIQYTLKKELRNNLVIGVKVFGLMFGFNAARPCRMAMEKEGACAWTVGGSFFGVCTLSPASTPPEPDPSTLNPMQDRIPQQLKP